MEEPENERSKGLAQVRRNRERIRSEGGPEGSIAIAERALRDAARQIPVEEMPINTDLIRGGYTPGLRPKSPASGDQSEQ
jgi:hypothetical protein